MTQKGAFHHRGFSAPKAFLPFFETFGKVAKKILGRSFIATFPKVSKKDRKTFGQKNPSKTPGPGHEMLPMEPSGYSDSFWLFPRLTIYQSEVGLARPLWYLKMQGTDRDRRRAARLSPSVGRVVRGRRGNGVKSVAGEARRRWMDGCGAGAVHVRRD